MRGDWGGLIFLGNAISNDGADQSAEGFALPRTYGGTNAAHNCGALKYVRVEFAGYAIAPDNELNGITFYACGTETKVDYVQSHMGLDDGIEWFGGGFDASHIIVTGAQDDSLDIDEGFQGSLQFVFVQQDPNAGDYAFEVSSNKTIAATAPVTRPLIANATVVGSGSSARSYGSSGMNLNQGASTGLFNSVIVNTDGPTFVVQSAETESKLASGDTIVNGNVFAPTNAETPIFSTRDGFDSLDAENLEVWLNAGTRSNKLRCNAGLPSLAWGNPDIQPPVGGTASSAARTIPAATGLVSTNYAGAVDPAATSNWTKAAWVNYSVQ